MRNLTYGLGRLSLKLQGEAAPTLEPAEGGAGGGAAAGGKPKPAMAADGRPSAGIFRKSGNHHVASSMIESIHGAHAAP
jgi:hypothetical protein